jgi:hypothetical protein
MPHDWITVMPFLEKGLIEAQKFLIVILNFPGF